MLPFSTEFPVKANQNRAAFIAEIIAWLRGNTASTVLDDGSEKELEGENGHIVSANGEELRIREISDNGNRVALGFRHDLPDQEGRVWRTEGVLKSKGAGRDDLLRLRAQCRAVRPEARLETPKKTYLVKSLLKGEWGAFDGEVAVSDVPVWLRDDDSALQMAARITEAAFTRWLPVVYISATDQDRWALSVDEIEKLAFDLGGVAHVVVEPNRRFSFALRDISGGRNVYSGAVGITVPNRGIVARALMEWYPCDSDALVREIKRLIGIQRERMPVRGWDWSDLQELALRRQRNAVKTASTSNDLDELFDELYKQMEDLKAEKLTLADQNAELQGKLVDLSSQSAALAASGANIEEIYPGEISDRLRYAATLALGYAETNGLDKRSYAVFECFRDGATSPDLAELRNDISRATKDPKRVAKELVTLLQRHGYAEKSDNKHIRLEAHEDLFGLDTLTLPKTPSDGRGLKNLRKQVERTMGLTNL